MARGEPPNRRKTRKYPTKGGDNAVIEWMKSYLMGLAGPFAGAADPTANIASQAGAFVPNQQLSAGGRVNADVTRQAINQRAMEAYDPATMQAGAGILGAGLAASAIRRPGAGLRVAASQIAKQRARDLAKIDAVDAARRQPPRVSAEQIAKQRQRDLAKIDAYDEANRPRFSPQEMTQAAQAAQRTAPPPRRIPPARFPSGKTPRTDAPRPSTPVEGLPVAGEQPVLTPAEARQAARKGLTPRQFLGEQETARRLKETGVQGTRRETAANAFREPRADSPEMARQEAAVREARANTRSAVELGDTVENLMARPDLGRSGNTGGPRVFTGRRNQRYSDAELANMQEQEAAQQAARKAAADAERAALKEQGLKSERANSPLNTQTEDQVAYERLVPKPKRSEFKGKGSKKKFDEAVANWDAGREEFVANRMQARGAMPSPQGDASAAPSFQPNVLDSDYNPYAFLSRRPDPAKPAAAKTPKAKKSKAKKTEEAAAQTPEEMPIPKRSKPSRAEKPEFANKSVDDSRTKKKFGPERPKQQKPKADTESPRDAGEKPRRVFAMGSKPESSRGVSTPLSDRPKRQAPDGGFAMPGRAAPEPSSARGKRGYLTAEEEKAVKARAKAAFAKGDRKDKKKFFGVAVGVGGPPAAAAGVFAFNKARDEKIAAEGAAESAEEAVTAEENGNQPKSAEAKMVLRDKYGRKITREEYNRREAFRKKLESMSPEQRKAARKKEMARREKWRNTIGKQLFKKAATKATRNVGKRQFASLDDSARRALRAS